MTVHYNRLITKLHADAAQCFSKLEDSRATKRKEGIQDLRSLIASPDYLKTLDYGSMLPKSAVRNLKPVMWHNLVHKFAAFATQQIQDAFQRNKPPEKLISKTLRELVSLAESSKRSGRTAVLSRKISQIFQCIIDVLEKTGIIRVDSEVTTDYVAILKMLLEEDEYIAGINQNLWVRMIEMHVNAITADRNSGGGRGGGGGGGSSTSMTEISSDQLHRIMASLSTFLKKYPSQPSPQLTDSILTFFSSPQEEYGDFILRCNDVKVRHIDIFDILSAFLLKCGPDIASKCPQLHSYYHGITMKALRGHDALTKARAVIYARVQLQLGGIRASKQMQDLVRWADQEITNAKWKPGFKNSKESQHELISLLCSVYVHAASLLGTWSDGSVGDGTNDGTYVVVDGSIEQDECAVETVLDQFLNEQQQQQQQSGRRRRRQEDGAQGEGLHSSIPVPSKKRARQSSPLSDLGKRAVESPASAAPVMATLLLQYYSILPIEDVVQWMQDLVDALSLILEQGATLESQKNNVVMWILYYLHALAMTSPSLATNSSESLQNGHGSLAKSSGSPTTEAAATSAAAAMNKRHSISCRNADSLRSSWSAVWNQLIQHITMKQIPIIERESSLWVLARIAERRLCQLPSNPHQLWNIPLMEWSLTTAGVRLTAAALRAGSDFVAIAGTWEENILRWALSGKHFTEEEERALDVSDVVDAYLKLPHTRVAVGDGLDRRSYDPATFEQGSSNLGSMSVSPTLHVYGFGLAINEDESWVWWNSNRTLEHQIGRLLSGAKYMHAKALSVNGERADKEALRMDAMARVSTVSAMTITDSMHNSAAACLHALLHDVIERCNNATAHQSQEQAGSLADRLQSLCSSCAVALHACAGVGALYKETKRRIPDCWLPQNDRTLFVKIFDAITEIAPLLASIASNGTEELSFSSKKAIALFAEALHRCRVVYRSSSDMIDRLRSALEPALDSLEAIFLIDTSPASLSTIAQVLTQGVAGGGGLGSGRGFEGDAMFDDDLDVGMRIASINPIQQSRRDIQPELTSAACLPTLHMKQAAWVLWHIVPSIPVEVEHRIAKIFSSCNESDGILLPPSISTALVDVSVSCAASAVIQNLHEAPALVHAALDRLDKKGGVLSSITASFPRCDYVVFVFDALRRLMVALLGPHGLGTAQQLMKDVYEVFLEALHLTHPIDGRMREIASSIEKVVSIRIARGKIIALMFEINNPRLIGDDQGELLAGLVFQMGRDECYEARISGASLIPRIFTQYKESMACYLDIKQSILRPSTGHIAAEYIETSIISFGTAAAMSSTVELDCLVELAREARASPGSLPLVAMTMNWLAISLGYHHRFDLLAWHHRKLVFEWCIAANEDEDHSSLILENLLSVRSIVAPSKRAAGNDTAFASECSPALVAAFVMLQLQDELLALAALLAVPMQQLVADNMDSVMATSLPGLHSTNTQVKEACEAVFQGGGFLESILHRDTLLNVFNTKIVSAIGMMLVSAEDPAGDDHEVLPPAFSPATIVSTIKTIPRASTQQQNDEILWDKLLRDSQVGDILLKIHARLSRAQNPEHASVAVASLTSALMLLEHRVAHPTTLRYATSMLVRSFKVPALRVQCARMLRDVIAKGLQSEEHDAVVVLSSLLPSAASSLAEAIEDSGNRGDDIQELVISLESITVHCPDILQPCLQNIDPLPTIYSMQRAAAVVTAARSKVDVAQQLIAFAERVASIPLTLRHHSIHALRALLAKQSSDAFHFNSSTGRKIAQAAWKLTSMSNELADGQLAEFAGELLALAGPLDPGKLAFDINTAASVHSTAGDSAASMQHPPPIQPVWSSSNTNHGNPWTFVLTLLHDYLIDDDTRVIGAAQACLRSLLSTEEGIEGKQKIHLHTVKNLIDVYAPSEDDVDFVCSNGLAQREKQGTRAMSTWCVDEGKWNAALAPSYDAWVCALTQHILSQCTSQALLSCTELVSLKPAFAELLLPLALTDWAIHSDSNAAEASDAALLIANAICRGIFRHLTAHRKATRIVLRCLNHLRNKYLAYRREPGKEGVPDMRTWHTVYWIKLDYIAVAAHAVKCKAYFTALLYIEEYCVAANAGRLVPPQSATDPNRVLVDALLLDIYSNINEPDGLYAVSMSSDLLPQLKRSEREGNWMDALVISDVALQLVEEFGSRKDPVENAARGNSGDGVGVLHGSRDRIGARSVTPPLVGLLDISKQDAVDGMARCLANLGASNMLSLVLAHHHSHNSNAVHSMLGDQRRRSNRAPAAFNSPLAAAATAMDAASLGSWMPLDPGTTEAASTDQSLLAAIDSLGAGGAERCAQAVSSARRSLVGALATAGLESTSDVNPALVRLQMFQDVTEAWKVLWPKLPLMEGNIAINSSSTADRSTGGVDCEPPARASPSLGAFNLDDSTELHAVWSRWRMREAAAGKGERYDLLAPLQDLHHRLLKTLCAPSIEAECLSRSALDARKMHRHGHANACLLRLHSMVRSAASTGRPWSNRMQSIAGPLALWRIETAKLCWAKGQKESAIAIARGLLVSLDRRSQQSDLRAIYLKSLMGKWMAVTQSDSSKNVLFLMQEATNDMMAYMQAQDETETINTEKMLDQSCRVYYRLGEYADTLYRNALLTISAPEWEDTAQAIKSRCEMIQNLLETRLNETNKHSLHVLDHNIMKGVSSLKDDYANRRGFLDNIDYLLHVVIENYRNCLMCGNKYDLPAIFRLIQLWFAIGSPSSDAGSTVYRSKCGSAFDVADHAAHALQQVLQNKDIQRSINEVVVRTFQEFCAISRNQKEPNMYTDIAFLNSIRDGFMSIASWKLIPLTYQIASRLSLATKSDIHAHAVFQRSLSEVLQKLGREHPHHTLPHLFALKNSVVAERGTVAVSRQKDSEWVYAADKDKASVANAILTAISMCSERDKKLIDSYIKVTNAYIEMNTPPGERNEIQLSRKFVMLLRSLQDVPVLTENISIDTSCQYSQDTLPYIIDINPKAAIQKGNSKPKLLRITDSRGRALKQLVKGGDDLRQDAVVQQFFSLMNRYLNDCRSTASRGLHLKTYKTVPLTPSAGLIQWVEGARELMEIFDPLYSRYKRTGDFSRGQAFNMMHNSKGTLEEKIGALHHVYSKFPPVLHHYFLERYQEPGAWFEARVRFTRSVAAGSIGGHIIGLGDRHGSNILVDISSCEIVHIDLGIAFEQGRDLRIPEQVPFRLTQNIVDAFGVTGVRGIFRRCCEETLRVVRAQKVPFMTLLEVFVHDPLYNWTFSLLKGDQRQGRSLEDGAVDMDVGGNEDDDGDELAMALYLEKDTATGGRGAAGNVHAKGAVFRIRQKLDGVERGDIGSRSVEGQVQHLIEEATGVQNLSRMYCGWQAFV